MIKETENTDRNITYGECAGRFRKGLLQTVKNGNKKLWPLGFAVTLLLAAAMLFGMLSYYRRLGYIMLLAPLLVLLFKRRWWLITAAELLGMTGFLLTFSPLGYKFMAAVTAFLAALVTVLRFAGKRVRRACLIVTLIMCLILTAIEIPIVKSARTDKDPERDYLIVLGAAVYGETPSLSLENRLKSAYAYLTAYPKSKAVLSGGKGKGEDISEAECMFRYLTEHGIEPGRLLPEPDSYDTYENLSRSRAVIEKDGGDISSVAVVSNTYHLYRAKLIASSLGMSCAGVAGIPGTWVYMCGMFLREAVAVTAYRLFGTI